MGGGDIARLSHWFGSPSSVVYFKTSPGGMLFIPPIVHVRHSMVSPGYGWKFKPVGGS